MRDLWKGESPRASSQPEADEPGPARLLSSGTEYERRLLASAAADAVVPDAAAARLEAKLGNVLVDGMASSGNTSPLAAAGGGLGAKQSAALAVLGAGVLAALAGGWHALSAGGESSARLREPAAIAAQSSPARALTPPANLGIVGAGSPEPVTEVQKPEPPPALAEPPRPPSREGAAPRESPSFAPVRHVPRAALDRGGALIEEVRALDALRAALRADDTRAAARQLMRYRARYPRGELQLESEVLAVHLAWAEGRRDSARASARALLARPGARRYAQQLQRVLDGSNARATDIEKAGDESP